MTHRLRIHPEARRELTGAFDWYEAQRTGLGRELLAELDAAFAAIIHQPLASGAWSARPRFRRFVLRRFPYILFYRLDSEEVVVVAIAHAKRRPGYWLKTRLRLGPCLAPRTCFRHRRRGRLPPLSPPRSCPTTYALTPRASWAAAT